MVALSSPALAVGVGGAGSRLAARIAGAMGIDCLRVGTDASEIGGGSGESILVATGNTINPSAALVRGGAMAAQGSVEAALAPYSSAILVGNLAGRDGSAIAPVVSRACRNAGIPLASLVIMPFRFEKDRLFAAGVALRRVREDSGCVIVADNDAVIDSNPEMSAGDARMAADAALLCAANALAGSPAAEGTSVAAPGWAPAAGGKEEALRSALKAVHASAPLGSAGRSVLHVAGGKGIPVGALDEAVRLAAGALGGVRVDYAEEAEGPGGPGVVVVSALRGAARFDSYDPLGIIPARDMLDWDEPECSIDCGLDRLTQLER